MNKQFRIAVLGAGIAGCCTALALARKGYAVTVIDHAPMPMSGASLHNEGKLHLGYVYAADPDSSTHPSMLRGSLSFLGVLEQLTGISQNVFSHSKPFTYGVPHDSQISLNQVALHFERVDAAINDIYSSDNPFHPALKPRPSCALSDAQLATAFDPSAVAGGFRTSEISLDTFQIADILGAAIRSNNRIHFVSDVKINGARRNVHGDYELETVPQDAAITGAFSVVVNCLWEDRIRLDKCVGIAPGKPWLLRYKAAVRMFYQHRPHLAEIPSATFITGPYGDIVNHGDGRFYLSWYPECKLGETPSDDCSHLRALADNADPARITDNSISGMMNFVPSAKYLQAVASRAQVGGGFIFAWGASDITDRASGLHRRAEIGPEYHGNWVSINTGKYCTAPLFALEAADYICTQIGRK